MVFEIRVADSSDNPSADSFSLKVPGVAGFVFLSTDDFLSLALLKDFEYFEITRDPLLTFAEAEGTKTVCPS